MKNICNLILFSASTTILLYSSPTFAYGKTVSTGKGIVCSVMITTQTINRTVCQAHVVSESKAPPTMIDINGQNYTSVNQEIDNADCIESEVDSRFMPINGQVENGVTGMLIQPTETFKQSAPKYNNDSGTIDLETRHGVRYYVSKEITPSAVEKDQALLRKVLANEYQSLAISYDARNLILTLSIVGPNGTREFTQAANFTTGRTSRMPDFTAQFKENLDPNHQLSSKRTFQATLACQALSEHRP